MLQKLTISNYAIIESLELEFCNGLVVITGETGAGKSIVMGALGLILGDRADSAVLMDQTKKSVIEGAFYTLGHKAVQSFLEQNNLDADEVLLLRREITVNGKSRSFINDTPVNLSQLKILASLMVDLHRQFDTLELGREDFQRDVLDALAENASHLTALKQTFTRYSGLKQEINELQALQEHAAKEADYNQFLFDELNELALKENELEDLDAELQLLNNAERIKQKLASIYFELKDSDQPLAQQVKVLSQKIQSQESFHPRLKELAQRMYNSYVELQDIAAELEQLEGAIIYDSQRIQWVNERISAGYKLLKKHGVNDTESLLAIQNNLQQKLNNAFNRSSQIEEKSRVAETLLAECTVLAGKVSQKRRLQVEPLINKVNALLARVGMPNATIKITLEETRLSSSGTDKVAFLFDANNRGSFEPLQKVASGGELSRLMLCVKSLVVQKLELPTLIFDEIDTGISGEAAKQVGIILKELAALRQVIAITHQPQIAAKASAHYFVYKHKKNNKIVTQVKKLGEEERVLAIAQMMGGEAPTTKALENAREMISN